MNIAVYRVRDTRSRFSRVASYAKRISTGAASLPLFLRARLLDPWTANDEMPPAPTEDYMIKGASIRSYEMLLLRKKRDTERKLVSADKSRCIFGSFAERHSVEPE